MNKKCFIFRNIFITVLCIIFMDIYCSRCGQGRIAPTSSGFCKFCLAKAWLKQPVVQKVDKLGIKELLDN